MKIAYADPPYIGQSKRYYSDHPDYAGEVNHRDLITKLAVNYQGWALSGTSSSLGLMLSLSPPGTRVAAFCRTKHQTRANVRPSYAWEPVLFHPARMTGYHERQTIDWYLDRPDGLGRQTIMGQKTLGFCTWIFEMLGSTIEDEFHDLFPGSGAVGRAWISWTKQAPLPFTSRKKESELFSEARRRPRPAVPRIREDMDEIVPTGKVAELTLFDP